MHKGRLVCRDPGKEIHTRHLACNSAWNKQLSQVENGCCTRKLVISTRCSASSRMPASWHCAIGRHVCIYWRLQVTPNSFKGQNDIILSAGVTSQQQAPVKHCYAALLRHYRLFPIFVQSLVASRENLVSFLSGLSKTLFEFRSRGSGRDKCCKFFIPFHHICIRSGTPAS